MRKIITFATVLCLLLSTISVYAFDINMLTAQTEDDVDFSSKRLLVKGIDEELEDEPVIASINGVSLLQYESEKEAEDAYNRLSTLSDTVEADSPVTIAGGSDPNPANTEIMTEKENPFTEADDIKVTPKKYDVAVIDTGANSADKILSVLGDDGKDAHGHGQQMIDTIKRYAPDAKVLSIKAIGDNGTGDASAVYAAIRLAIDEKVDVINLSISAMATENNFIIEEIIKEAESKGITVVGAAGNDSMDAAMTIPGRIKEATIAGATTEESNTGDTVDYYLNVSSTSVAAAVISGLILSDTLDDYEVVDKVITLENEDAYSADFEEYDEDYDDETLIFTEEELADFTKTLDLEEGEFVEVGDVENLEDISPEEGDFEVAAKNGTRIWYESSSFTNGGKAKSPTRRFKSTFKSAITGEKEAFAGTCARCGVTALKKGYAKVTRVKNTKRIAKFVYYFGYKKKWWSNTATGNMSAYKELKTGNKCKTCRRLLIQCMTQIQYQGKTTWLNEYVRCNGDRSFGTRVANWCLNQDVSDVNVPDRFEMYFCTLVKKDGTKITDHQPFYIWRLNSETIPPAYITLRKVSTATEDYTGILGDPEGDYGDVAEVGEDDGDDTEGEEDVEPEEDEEDWEDTDFGDTGGEIEAENTVSKLYSLEGAVYEVRDSDNNVVGTFVTNADGDADEILEVPKAGTYKVKETRRSKGFKLDPKEYTVKVTEANDEDNPAVVGIDWPDPDTGDTIKATPEEPIGYPPEISIYKIPDAENPDDSYWENIPPLAGAEFILRYYRVENKEDIATAPVIAAWKYQAKAENRCWLNSKWITTNGKFGLVEIGKDQPISVYNRDEDDPLFHATDDDPGSLPLGWYTIKESKAPEHYEADESKTVYMLLDDQGGYTYPSFYDENGTNLGMDTGYGFTLRYPNKPIPPTITMHKKAGKDIPEENKALYSLENAKYKLLNEDGTDAKDINGNFCTFTTDVNGKARETYSVLPGKYKIQEIEASRGFKIDTAIQNTIIDLPAGKYIEEPYDAESIEEPNEPGIKIRKSISNSNAVSGNPLYSVAGTTFALYRTQADARTGSNPVKTFTISANGESAQENVFLGSYYLVETNAGSGLLIPDALKASAGGVQIVCDTTKTINIP